MNTPSPGRPVSSGPLRRPLDRRALDDAKQTVTIPDAWRALGLPGEPARTCCSPFREERNPSFSITADGLLWHDFATGQGGDVVSFVQVATDCTDAEAIARVIDFAGTTPETVALAPRRPAKPAPPKRDALTGLDLREPSIGELAKIAVVRDWPSLSGLEIALDRGLLRVADVQHRGETFPAWVITDNARRTGQARRLDGEQWPGPEGRTFKSLSLRSDDDAPPGLADIVEQDRSGVVIAEGEPDALAVLMLAWLADVDSRMGVICLTGAARGLTTSVLSALRGRRVRIIRQTDVAGHRAALAWLESLIAAGIDADVLPLDGLRDAQDRPAKDLADLCRRPADHETLLPLAAHICAPFRQ